MNHITPNHQIRAGHENDLERRRLVMITRDTRSILSYITWTAKEEPLLTTVRLLEYLTKPMYKPPLLRTIAEPSIADLQEEIEKLKQKYQD